MKISKKIKQLNKLAREFIENDSGKARQFIQIGIERTNSNWLVSIHYEIFGSGKMEYYLDPNNGRPIIVSEKTLPRALNKLEEKLTSIVRQAHFVIG